MLSLEKFQEQIKLVLDIDYEIIPTRSTYKAVCLDSPKKTKAREDQTEQVAWEYSFEQGLYELNLVILDPEEDREVWMSMGSHPLNAYNTLSKIS